ncbi:MAG TPA: DMT family transporter [Acidothermaceae bacterium]|nr:DMT family transporter [Acidothermaceae bacterium]
MDTDRLVSMARLEPHPRRGVSLAIVSAISFGAAGPFSKAVLTSGDLTPLRLAQIRITMAAGVMLGVVLARRLSGRRPSYRWTRADVWLVTAYGSLGFVGVQICYFIAIDRLPVGVALLFEYVSVVLVAVYAAVVQHRPQPRAVWAGVTLAVIGLVVLTEPWSGFQLNVWGSIAGAGAALGCAAYFLIGERGTARMPVLELTAYGAGVGAIVLAFVLPVWTFPFSALGHSARFAGHATPVWILLSVVVIVGTVLAYLLGMSALAYLPSPSATVISTLEIVVGAVVAWGVLGEHMTVAEIAGGVIILTGVVVVAERARLRTELPVLDYVPERDLTKT